MITETAQLLHSTYYFTQEFNKANYKLTHKNHPCSIWTRKSLSNWNYLKNLGINLYNEYKYRYGNKKHKSGELLTNNTPIPNLNDYGLTLFTQCIPDKYKSNDPVKAYREYYIHEKSHLFSWKNRNKPYWV
jgi:hypothetical protein